MRRQHKLPQIGPIKACGFDPRGGHFFRDIGGSFSCFAQFAEY